MAKFLERQTDARDDSAERRLTSLEKNASRFQMKGLFFCRASEPLLVQSSSKSLNL